MVPLIVINWLTIILSAVVLALIPFFTDKFVCLLFENTKNILLHLHIDVPYGAKLSYNLLNALWCMLFLTEGLYNIFMLDEYGWNALFSSHSYSE